MADESGSMFEEPKFSAASSGDDDSVYEDDAFGGDEHAPARTVSAGRDLDDASGEEDDAGGEEDDAGGEEDDADEGGEEDDAGEGGDEGDDGDADDGGDDGADDDAGVVDGADDGADDDGADDEGADDGADDEGPDDDGADDDDDEGGEDDGLGAANRLRGGAAKAVLEHVTKMLVDDPESVVVEVSEGRSGLRFSVHVAQGDMGRIIGRRGRTAQAIRTLVRAAAASEGVEASVDIVD